MGSGGGFRRTGPAPIPPDLIGHAVSLSGRKARYSLVVSQENVELLRAYHDEVTRASREDLDPEAAVARMAAFWHPEVAYDVSESPWFDLRGLYRGIAACRTFWREWFEAWETLEFEYQLVDAGDCVVALLDSRMRGRSTGIEVRFGKAAFLTTFEDGLMFHNRFYMSQSEALEHARQTEHKAPS